MPECIAGWLHWQTKLALEEGILNKSYRFIGIEDRLRTIVTSYDHANSSFSSVQNNGQ